MAEYICKEYQITRANGDIVGVGLNKVERLVQCRDCKFGVKTKNGLGEDVVECNNSDLSMMGDCHFPDWYCADGEPKDGEHG